MKLAQVTPVLVMHTFGSLITPGWLNKYFRTNAQLMLRRTSVNSPDRSGQCSDDASQSLVDSQGKSRLCCDRNHYLSTGTPSPRQVHNPDQTCHRFRANLQGKVSTLAGRMFTNSPELCFHSRRRYLSSKVGNSPINHESQNTYLDIMDLGCSANSPVRSGERIMTTIVYWAAYRQLWR